MFAEVVFNLPLNHSFTYSIPSVFKNLQLGQRVIVPFGKRIITGVVVSFKEKSTFKSTKEIIDVLDETALIKPEMLNLTNWISEYYLSSWGQAIQLALPKGIDAYESQKIFLVEENPNADLNERQRELYFIIADNPGKSKTFYRKKFGNSSYYNILYRLHQKGLIYSETEMINARVGTLMRSFVQIPKNYEELRDNNTKFLKYIKSKPHIDEILIGNRDSKLLTSDFLKQTRMARATLQKMAANGIVELKDLALERKPEFEFSENNDNIILNSDQKNAIEKIVRHAHQKQFKSFLLHGITGSGKTVVYIEILKHVIQQGRTAIILIPEIALTPQTVSRFKAVFSEQIAVFHSKMSIGQRYDAWMACYKNQIKIVIGPRSALFAPLENIGLIVVDEEHEQSYKQTESAPLYNARDVALYWGKIHNALVVLGSATPSFESYYNTYKSKHDLLELKERPTEGNLPVVHLIDLKEEKKQSKSDNIFSRLLLQKVEEKLVQNEQIIVLQNRRGFASFQQCRNCGFIPKCSACEVSLTYHNYDRKLRCHYCGLTIPATHQCANCGADDMENRGIGTQRIYDELQTSFPDIKILRMDQDTTKAANAHDTILNTFRNGHASILLGTQMISKGLDFPNVTLVGVISADVGLSIPDFRAPEKVFQLMTQVAGRSGRGAKKGEVIIQGYQIEHYAIQFAQKHDYIGFFNKEMEFRKKYNYPPLQRLIQVTVSAANISETITIARSLAINLRKKTYDFCTVVGPAPAAISKIKSLFRWQINLKINGGNDPAGTKTKTILSKIVETHQKGQRTSYYISIDVDPVFSA